MAIFSRTKKNVEQPTRRMGRRDWILARLRRNIQRIYRFTFGERLTLSFLAIAFIPIALLSILAIYFNTQFIKWNTFNEMKLLGEKASLCIEFNTENWEQDTEKIASSYSGDSSPLKRLVDVLPALLAIQIKNGDEIVTYSTSDDFANIPLLNEGLLFNKGSGGWLLCITKVAPGVQLNFLYDFSLVISKVVSQIPPPYFMRMAAADRYIISEKPLDIGVQTSTYDTFNDSFFGISFLPAFAFQDDESSFVEVEKGILPLSHGIIYQVLVGAKPNHFLSKVADFRSQLASFVLLSFVCVLFFSMLFSQIIARPVGRAAKQARTLDVSTSQQIPKIEYPNDDEIGDLVHEINRLARYYATTMEQYSANKTDLEIEIEKIAGQLEMALREIATINKGLKEKIDTQAGLLVSAEKKAILANLVQGLTHNLKTPVASLLGYLQLLGVNNLERANRIKTLPEPYRSKELDIVDEEQQWITTMIDNCSRLMDIVNSILDRAYARELPSRITIDMNDLVRKELVFLESDLFFKHQIDKELELQIGLPPIFATYSDISQVVGNILQNSREALEDAPVKRLFIKTWSNDESVYLSIKDTGEGISEENLGKIFQSYFSTKAGKTFIGGSGLGLSSSEEILKRYNGVLSVESEFGKGAKFTVQLPVFLNEETE